MRNILRKLERKQNLPEDEYRLLMEYINELALQAPESYQLFYSRYADTLYKDYDTFIPPFSWGKDDFIDFLLIHPDLIRILNESFLHLNDLPVIFRPYLSHTFTNGIITGENIPWLGLIMQNSEMLYELPRPRTGDVIYKYENSNPYKEPGLKTHFERIGRYSFVTRLHSYRYLTRNKAHNDKFEVMGTDSLKGIFTNKQKSIYYYIYLTEQNKKKAANACRLLNIAFYE